MAIATNNHTNNASHDARVLRSDLFVIYPHVGHAWSVDAVPWVFGGSMEDCCEVVLLTRFMYTSPANSTACIVTAIVVFLCYLAVSAFGKLYRLPYYGHVQPRPQCEGSEF
jgi:hypothetical protein